MYARIIYNFDMKKLLCNENYIQMLQCDFKFIITLSEHNLYKRKSF